MEGKETLQAFLIRAPLQKSQQILSLQTRIIEQSLAFDSRIFVPAKESIATSSLIETYKKLLIEIGIQKDGIVYMDALHAIRADKYMVYEKFTRPKLRAKPQNIVSKLLHKRPATIAYIGSHHRSPNVPKIDVDGKNFVPRNGNGSYTSQYSTVLERNVIELRSRAKTGFLDVRGSKPPASKLSELKTTHKSGDSPKQREIERPRGANYGLEKSVMTAPSPLNPRSLRLPAL